MTDQYWEELREKMVREQLEARGIEPAVCDAMRQVPRELFVPVELRSRAYDDGALSIGHGQTISQPYTVAFMIQALQLQGDEKVLEIGTGSGYAAAVLSRLCREVHTVERIAELAEAARQRLKRLGYDNVHVHVRDGVAGLPEHAPFDAIVAAAAAEELPTALLEQLADGGRLVLPIGPAHGVQTMMRYVKEGDRVRSQRLGQFAFVPLVGAEKKRRGFFGQVAGLTAGGIFAARSAHAAPAIEEVSGGVVSSGQRGAVATVHPLATEAGIEALRRGGNAIDAAVASSLMLSVVDGFNSGLGGGGLAMVRTGGRVHAVDGREMAPARATPDMYIRDGKPDPQLSRIGPLAVGVPGLVALLHRLATRWGKLDWTWALHRAADVAENGFELDANYVARTRTVASRLRRFPEAAAIFLDENGQPWPVGHRLRQTDLARTLRSIASEGPEWFYRGPFAERLEQLMQRYGGIMTADDLANYKIVHREPIVWQYRANQVFGFPPPSSGGIHVAQMLGMLERFDVAAISRDSEVTWRHLLIESMKRAMADRAYWLGDADFAKVPRGLLDPDYLASRAATIDLQHATKVEGHGLPPRANDDFFGRQSHTTHLTAADAEGNVVALTQTINTTYGSKMVVPGTGVVLNNEMDDFSIAPGVPNAFGLLGSKANAVAPGKRPLSSMSPTIVMGPDGHWRVTCGAAGGPKIITTVLQILVRTLDLQQSIAEAIAAPRTHHQWFPDEVVCEQSVPEEVVRGLEELGHRTRRIETAAVAQGLAKEGQTLLAASDPRVPSAAACL